MEQRKNWMIIVDAGVSVAMGVVMLEVVNEDWFSHTAYYWLTLVGVGLAVFLLTDKICYAVGKRIFAQRK